MEFLEFSYSFSAVLIDHFNISYETVTKLFWKNYFSFLKFYSKYVRGSLVSPIGYLSQTPRKGATIV